MEKIKKYQKIVEKVLNERLRFPTPYSPNLKDILVIDKERKHFMVITFGWDNQKEYVNSPIFHLEVTKNGKVLIHDNNTDVQIDEILLENKIADKDLLDGMEETYPRTLADTKAA